jgi:DNA-binding response OmpR family regulator
MSKSILVVDDELDVREFLHDLLTDEGYSVRLAEDGEKAMEMIAKEKPELILLDLMMPKETGTDLYRKIHRKKDFEKIPVIVISGLPGRYLALSKSIPVFDKPIDEKKLLEQVKAAIG